ncbi:hypothetical protein KC360_g222 [Hortaea werneckii]|nr:hypothetical protein KC344_g225 [Hortaea werneckii]KAI7180557.1 hypothetical protein KC360_g222 [Hortaea werneckii]
MKTLTASNAALKQEDSMVVKSRDDKAMTWQRLNEHCRSSKCHKYLRSSQPAIAERISRGHSALQHGLHRTLGCERGRDDLELVYKTSIEFTRQFGR